MFRNFNLKRLPVLDPMDKRVVGIIDRIISEKAAGHNLGGSLVSVLEAHFALSISARFCFSCYLLTLGADGNAV